MSLSGVSSPKRSSFAAGGSEERGKGSALREELENLGQASEIREELIFLSESKMRGLAIRARVDVELFDEKCTSLFFQNQSAQGEECIEESKRPPVRDSRWGGSGGVTSLPEVLPATVHEERQWLFSTRVHFTGNDTTRRDPVWRGGNFFWPRKFEKRVEKHPNQQVSRTRQCTSKLLQSFFLNFAEIFWMSSGRSSQQEYCNSLWGKRLRY